MSRSKKVRNERGIALITVLLVALAVSGIALAAAMWTLNATLITKSGDRTATLNDIALAGLEEGRSQLNANPAVYPGTGYATLAAAAPVTDVLGTTVPNVLRSIYVGPDGITGGQYGVYLYGFPCQQLVAHAWPDAGPWRMLALALPLALGCAIVSWHCIQQPFLRLKPKD